MIYATIQTLQQIKYLLPFATNILFFYFIQDKNITSV